MRKRPILASLVTMLAVATTAPAETAHSELAEDEEATLFNAAGFLDSSGARWRVPMQGWVYEPEDSRVRKRLIEALLERSYGLEVTPASRTNFDRRVNALLADNERGKRIVVELDGRRFRLPASEPNGHFRDVVELAAEGLTERALTARVILDESDSRALTGAVRLIEPAGLSVISDIDDTIKITEVRDRRAMLERSLLRDFEAVPGMAARYRAWAQRGVAFHFVSSSPWHLYPFLETFTREAGFPWATFSLKHVRVKDETVLDLFKPGTQTKPEQIEALLERFPGRQFVLIGDNGEQDPEAYAAVMARHRTQVLRIYIRNVAGERAEDPRYQRAFAGIERSRWQLFEDPATLELPGEEP